MIRKHSTSFKNYVRQSVMYIMDCLLCHTYSIGDAKIVETRAQNATLRIIRHHRFACLSAKGVPWALERIVRWR